MVGARERFGAFGKRRAKCLLVWLGGLLLGWPGTGGVAAVVPVSAPAVAGFAAGAVNPVDVMALPLPAGARQAGLRLARPGVPGYWQVRWVQAAPLPQVLAQWRQQYGARLDRQALAPGLWRLNVAGSPEWVLLHVAPASQGVFPEASAWWLARWHTTRLPSHVWQGLQSAESLPRNTVVLADWLTDQEGLAVRQRVWANSRHDPQRWAGLLAQRWQREGWQGLVQAGPADGAPVRVWQRQRVERSLVVVASHPGSAAVITDRVLGPP